MRAINYPDEITLRMRKILRLAAEKWLIENPEQDPLFSSYGGMIFDENDAATDIGDAMMEAIRKSDPLEEFTVRQIDIATAALTAKLFLRTNTKSGWVKL